MKTNRITFVQYHLTSRQRLFCKFFPFPSVGSCSALAMTLCRQMPSSHFAVYLYSKIMRYIVDFSVVCEIQLTTLQGGFDLGLSSLPFSHSSPILLVFVFISPSITGWTQCIPSQLCRTAIWLCPCGINICKLQPSHVGTSCLPHCELQDQEA